MEEDLDHRAAGKATPRESGTHRHGPITHLHQPFVEAANAHIALPGSNDELAGPQVAHRCLLQQKAVPGGCDGCPSLLVEQPSRGTKSQRLYPERIGERVSGGPGRIAGGRGRQAQEFGRPSSQPGAAPTCPERTVQGARCPVGPAVRHNLAAGGHLGPQQATQIGVVGQRPAASIARHYFEHPRSDGSPIQLVQQPAHTGCKRRRHVMHGHDEGAPGGRYSDAGHQQSLLPSAAATRPRLCASAPSAIIGTSWHGILWRRQVGGEPPPRALS